MFFADSLPPSGLGGTALLLMTLKRFAIDGPPELPGHELDVIGEREIKRTQECVILDLFVSFYVRVFVFMLFWVVKVIVQ